jgi:hypothetical protein
MEEYREHNDIANAGMPGRLRQMPMLLKKRVIRAVLETVPKDDPSRTFTSSSTGDRRGIKEE